MGKSVVISGGTSGMGRATALARHARGDRVTVIGSNEAKGRTLPAGVRFLQADLSSVAEVHRVAAEITEPVDALALFANRPSSKRRETADGLEFTFALYYLSRYLLGHLLKPRLDAAPDPVIVNIAGVGTTAGRLNWDDPQSREKYSLVRAQLQAGRANDLLGVSFAAQGHRARYVLYHPGFTRSGLDGHESPLVRGVLKTLATFFARPVADSVRPIVDWIGNPPGEPLTAIDRGKPVALTLKTLDPADAARLDAYTTGLAVLPRPR
ncbi:NAD(P)-dependent dehydrogenase (short-subunit alcohol dehydrogenase family) [Kibdelosporangium banguiense]|uniref:NAD(P)-dependent dehydrogenase (Short-subunit alcohol dehydrogenase family) n=1 Tax=Kibdelosporangium banguiense TaxID=1365924 RepID=A0ABS4TNZ7_9PSEU|nr:SDR family NAD(P)-dependent oxidoreductase [Kibdelosporangium banguiense]MBP2326121.1 NAD(P)-dependent dehydrogenase (short-subunit alcohol dehydrogenase family) [Kibdelosporangium banguiense]